MKKINANLENLAASSELLNDPIILVDSSGIIHYMSSALAKWLNVEAKEFSRKSIFSQDIPYFLSIYHKFTTQINKQHQNIIETKDQKVFLETYRNDDESIALFVTKTPIYDQENNFLFLHLRFKQFTIARVANLAYKFYGIKGFPIKVSDFEKYALTRIQSMVLYMYARNYSYTEVSNLLTRFGYQISPSAVNKQLDKLKKIFGVNNNELLRDMSLKLGYDVAIPAEFIPEGSHDITGDIFELWVC